MRSIPDKPSLDGLEAKWRERWAADWLAWPGFQRFITQAVRWTMPDPANRNLQTSVAFEGEDAIITIDATGFFFPRRSAK